MKKIAVIVGAIVALLVVVPFFVPKRLYLGWAITAVESRYPVKLKIEDAGLWLLPRVSVSLKNVTATSTEPGAETLIKAGRLSVGIGWLDLLAKRPALIIGLRDAVIGDNLRADGDISTDLVPAESGRPGRLKLASRNLSLSAPGSLAMKNEKVSFESDLSKHGSKTEIKNGTLKVGPQSFAVGGSRSDNGALNLTLASDDLNLGYLKKILPGLKGLPPVEDAGLKARYVTDGSPRSKPTISGDLTAKKVSLDDQELKNASASFVYRDPFLKISNLKANTLDGTLTGGAALSMAPGAESYDFDIDVKNAAVNQLSSVGKLVQGRGDLALKGRGQGFDRDRFVKSLRGDGNLNVREVRIPALGVFQSIASSPVWALLKKIPGTLDDSALQGLKGLDSKMHDLAGAFQIVNGAIQVPRVNLQFPNAVTSLGGGIGLDKTLDFSGNVSLERALVGTFIKNPRVLDALTKSGPLAVPIKVTGSVSRPVVLPDAGAIRSKLQTALAQGVQEKARETVEKAVKEGQLPKKEDLPTKEQLKDILKQF
ncbi:MAG TPA: AsmA-like C-terminal region-containing protein [bacterium]|nr:AsmA-like C-terminal region-containing protein [bacterium]